ncbi:hypothetical protein QBC34DRAFT_223541 [Podospora aff. communis PSN243]|uniref:Uncharacterized protein n=1 Tax=Podospora aff. communis PSN243 TaxID=3040156 RepID=A0AAV9G3R8_9PEZI|nr:hypothetical protein QBC34DRAFT_223541 [Podospora aff. communis PSN243]
MPKRPMAARQQTNVRVEEVCHPYCGGLAAANQCQRGMIDKTFSTPQLSSSSGPRTSPRLRSTADPPGAHSSRAGGSEERVGVRHPTPGVASVAAIMRRSAGSWQCLSTTCPLSCPLSASAVDRRARREMRALQNFLLQWDEGSPNPTLLSYEPTSSGHGCPKMEDTKARYLATFEPLTHVSYEFVALLGCEEFVYRCHCRRRREECETEAVRPAQSSTCRWAQSAGRQGHQACGLPPDVRTFDRVCDRSTTWRHPKQTQAVALVAGRSCRAQCAAR